MNLLFCVVNSISCLIYDLKGNRLYCLRFLFGSSISIPISFESVSTNYIFASSAVAFIPRIISALIQFDDVFVLVYYTANEITEQGVCFKTRLDENI